MRGIQIRFNVCRIVFYVLAICFSSSLFAQTHYFQNLNHNDYQLLPEDLKRIHQQTDFSIKHLITKYPNQVIKKSLFIGHPDAPIINAVGGTFTNALYMREYALRLALKTQTNLAYNSNNLAKAIQAKAFAVNLTEPSGFGNSLTGVISAPRNLNFGLMEMIAEHLFSMEILSEISGHKVLNIGHSLGGFILDFSSIGVRTDKAGKLYLDHSYAQEVSKKIRGNILLGTPFALASHDLDAHLIPLLTVIGPKIIDRSPVFQKLYRWLHQHNYLSPEQLHMPLSQLQKTSSFFLPGRLENFSLIPLVDLRLLRASDIHELANHTLSKSYPTKILREFDRMLSDGDLMIDFENKREISLKNLYRTADASARVASFINTNRKDPVSRPKDLYMHVTFLRALGVQVSSMIQEGGHMNSPLGLYIIDSVEAAALMFRDTESALNNQDASNALYSCSKSAK